MTAPSVSSPLDLAIAVDGLPAGMRAWTTTRNAGSFGLGSDEPVGIAMDRWASLLDGLACSRITRLATATQVHGSAVSRHDGEWRGWLRQRGVDGHVTTTPQTALAVTVADCTPVFIAHPAGAIAALHAGWRGTAARIIDVGFDMMETLGFPASGCTVHLGPSICGACYEVGPEVLSAVLGRPATAKALLDVRAVLAQQAERRKVRELTISRWCTKCHTDRFFSHRAGDSGRQLGIITYSTDE